MTTITFDTFRFVDRLEKAGATRELAVAMADAQKEAFSEALDSSVATKADLFAVKSDLKSDIARLDNKIDSLSKDMQAMELRLTVKLGTFIAVAVASTAALVKLL